MAKKTITITLKMSELIYDIENKTWLTGRSRNTGDNYDAVSHMQADELEENRNQILRSIGNAYGTLKVAIGEWLSDSTDSANNEQIGDDDLILSLHMPMNYNQANNTSLTASLHQYIVNTAIADWFTHTNPQEASAYATFSATNLQEITEAIIGRVRPSRP